MVLADTSIWSLALRRRSEDLNRAERRLLSEWFELVRDGRVRLMGPIRQEILSGDFERYAKLLPIRLHRSRF